MIWLQRGLIAATVVLLGAFLPTLFFDDAYITFRYAMNLAAGDGFTWNPPERVLGVTTPLYTLLLAGAARAGADLESAALWFGLGGHLLMCLMVFEAMRLLVPDEGKGARLVPLGGALLCAIHPHLALTAMGGMETPLYVGLLLATFVAAARTASGGAGGLLGLALLARPDAVLAAPPAAWLLKRAGGRLLPAAITAGVVATPWVLYAMWAFGSPLPHSIAAKRVVHPYGPFQILVEFGSFLWDDPMLLAAIPLALWGLERRKRNPLSLALAAFCVLYLTAYAASGITPFPWYVNPLLPPLLMLGLAGVDDLLGRVRIDRRVSWAAVLVVALVFAGAQLAKQSRMLSDAWEQWEGQYEIVARWLMSSSRPGDRILVGEVGVVGYLLPERVVIDSSGINSPEVLKLRRGRREEDPQWTRDVIQKLRPDYIATSIDYLNIRVLSEEPWFQQSYQRVGPPLLDREGQVIFKRR